MLYVNNVKSIYHDEHVCAYHETASARNARDQIAQSRSICGRPGQDEKVGSIVLDVLVDAVELERVVERATERVGIGRRAPIDVCRRTQSK